MICRLYSEEVCTHFKLEWVPLAHHIDEIGQEFNWAHIFSVNLLRANKGVSGNKKSGFYISTFLIDVIYSPNYFPFMG
jgi:hypothetical protein